MTATPAQIAFALLEYRTVTAQDADVAARYGNRARRTDAPLATYLDDIADAQAVADQRLDLLGKARRSFSVTVQGLDEVLALPRSATARVIDPQTGLERDMLITQVEIDYGDQTAELTVWG